MKISQPTKQTELEQCKKELASKIRQLGIDILETNPPMSRTKRHSEVSTLSSCLRPVFMDSCITGIFKN
jgi:hypothetical protein